MARQPHVAGLILYLNINTQSASNCSLAAAESTTEDNNKSTDRRGKICYVFHRRNQNTTIIIILINVRIVAGAWNACWNTTIGLADYSAPAYKLTQRHSLPMPDRLPFQVSQLYVVRLHSLWQLNRMEPTVGLVWNRIQC